MKIINKHTKTIIDSGLDDLNAHLLINEYQNDDYIIVADTIVFVLHHTNSGTPESGEIHSIYTTKSAALAAMAVELDEGYDGVTVQENEDENFDYMYITEQYLNNNNILKK